MTGLQPAACDACVCVYVTPASAALHETYTHCKEMRLQVSFFWWHLLWLIPFNMYSLSFSFKLQPVNNINLLLQIERFLNPVDLARGGKSWTNPLSDKFKRTH